jgi:hypothetical protein
LGLDSRLKGSPEARTRKKTIIKIPMRAIKANRILRIMNRVIYSLL